MTRSEFIGFCMAGIAMQDVADAAAPSQQRVSPRPHGSAAVGNFKSQYTWCLCDDCETWDEQLESRVRASVARALPAFWKTIREEYGLKGEMPDFVPTEDLIDQAFETARDWIEEDAGICELVQEKL